MKSAKAFAPGNISCIFVICPDKNPAKMGSLGIGITVEKGAIVKAKKSKKLVIRVNKKDMYFPTVFDVVRRLAKEPVKIDIRYQLPYGCGFGMSGASVLATAFALNKLFNLKKSNKELALIAHIAEVENRTGLGDVAGEFHGGVCAKYEKGNPLNVVRFPIKEKHLYYKIFSPLDTKKVITNDRTKNKINKAGLKALNKIKQLKNKNLIDIIKVSREFSYESGLIRDKKVDKLIKEIEKNKQNASMIMLGNAVYSDKPFRGLKKIRIVTKGAHLL